jgi:hypothetical protein
MFYFSVSWISGFSSKTKELLYIFKASLFLLFFAKKKRSLQWLISITLISLKISWRTTAKKIPESVGKQGQSFHYCCGRYFSDAQYQCSDAQLRVFGYKNWMSLSNVTEKSIDKEIAMGPRNGSILMRLTAFLIV